MEDPTMSTSAPLPPLPPPSSIQELEALIQRFYGPNAPEEYKRIDTCLKAVQLSPQGLLLADQLMNSSDANVRFFGALTFMVQLNRDGQALHNAHGEDLLDRLLYWFVRCVNGGDISIVIRKLCSALIAFFQWPEGEWTLCIRHAMLCLIAGDLVDYAEVISRTNVRGIVASLSRVQVAACLWLCAALMEGQGWSSAGSEWHRVTVRALKNVSDMLDLVEHCLNSDISNEHSLAVETVKLVQIIWTHEGILFESGTEEQSRLYSLTVAIVSHLGPNELLPTISELITPTINRHFSNPIQQVVMRKIVSDEFALYQQQLQDGEFDDDNLVYGRLLVELGGVLVDDTDFAENLDPYFDQILERLTALAGAKGYPMEEDALCLELIIFWTSYSDWIVELQSISEDEPNPRRQHWIDLSSGYISRVLEAFLKKLQLPPPEIFSTWDKQTQSAFRSLRRDFRDFSASAFLQLGTSMLDTLVNYLQRLWNDRNWHGAEITLQCLKGVIEAVIDTDTGDTALNTMLTCSIFSSNTSDIPLNIQQVSIDLVADCSPFLARQSYAPMGLLQWLFQALDVPTLAFPAAKAISSVCDSCGTKFASNGVELVNLFSTIVNSNNQQPEVVERLASAVGAVLQAMWTESKGQPERDIAMAALDKLLNTVSRHIVSPGENNGLESKDQQITAIQSLVNVGREFMNAYAEMIDLDTGDLDRRVADPRTIPWATARRDQITAMISEILRKFPSDGDLMEAVCLLLRAGTTDELDNPFRIDDGILICLVTNYLGVTDRPGFLLDTISRWIRSSLHWVKNDDTADEPQMLTGQRRNEIALACFLHVSQCLWDTYHASDGPREHAEQISSMIEFLSEFLIGKDIQSMVLSQAALDLFSQACQISVNCFDLPEPILKQAASVFWIRLLDIRPVHGETNTSNQAITGLTVHLLPSLTKSLVHALSGSSARSDIDAMVAPFRRLITFPIPREFQSTSTTNSSSMTARSLITAALFTSDFPSKRVSEKDKLLFVEKILRLRGDGAGTGRICKEWWVACRGTFK